MTTKERRHIYYLTHKEFVLAKNLIYQHSHPEQISRRRKRYRERNEEEIRAAKKAYYLKNRDRILARGRKRDLRDVMLKAAKARCKGKNVPIDITVDDIYIPLVCPVLGIPIKPSKTKHSDNSPSLDRIIPSKGYVRGNICVISHRANDIKNAGSAEEHDKVATYIRKYTEPK